VLSKKTADKGDQKSPSPNSGSSKDSISLCSPTYGSNFPSPKASDQYQSEEVLVPRSGLDASSPRQRLLIESTSPRHRRSSVISSATQSSSGASSALLNPAIATLAGEISWGKFLSDPLIAQFFRDIPGNKRKDIQRAIMAFVASDDVTDASEVGKKHAHLKLKITDEHFDSFAECLLSSFEDLGVGTVIVEGIMERVEECRSFIVGTNATEDGDVGGYFDWLKKEPRVAMAHIQNLERALHKERSRRLLLETKVATMIDQMEALSASFQEQLLCDDGSQSSFSSVPELTES